MCAIAGAAALSVACADTPVVGDAPTRVQPVAFAAIVRQLDRVALAASDTGAVATTVAALLTPTSLFVLDRKHADLRRYSRTSGALGGVVATAGDAPGQLRRPAAMAALDSGQFVVLDDGRRMLSFRDSLGALIREARLPDGSYTSVVPLLAEHRIVVAGRVYYGPDSIRARDLHEFDHDGGYRASYGVRAEARSPWHKAFSAVLVADAGSELAIGTLASNRVRFVDRRRRTERSAAFAAGWFSVLEFPSDRLLQHGATQQSAAARVSVWTRQHRLLNGMFPLARDRMLVRFQAFDPSGARFFYYALADRTGATSAITRPTRANVLAARGDTLYWIEREGGAGAALVTAVVAPNGPVAPALASARP